MQNYRAQSWVPKSRRCFGFVPEKQPSAFKVTDRANVLYIPFSELTRITASLSTSTPAGLALDGLQMLFRRGLTNSNLSFETFEGAFVDFERFNLGF
jgi:hypothetical protein